MLRFETAVDDAVSGFAAGVPAGSRVLDAGAGEGRHAGRFAHCRYVATDLGVGDAAWDYSHLDALADLVAQPFADGTFSAALCIVVLEHVRDPQLVVHELGRVLAPGGRILIAVPQEWERHQEPHDYFRFTSHGVRTLLDRAGVDSVSIVPVGGLFTLLGRRVHFAVLLCQGGWRWLFFPWFALVCWPLGVALPWLDWLDRDKAHTLGYIVHGRRRGGSA